MTDATITHLPRRHSWGDAVYFPYKTERTCNHCGICKVTRHEPGVHPWLEFYRGLDKLSVSKTPACEPISVSSVPDSADGAASAEREIAGTAL